MKKTPSPTVLETAFDALRRGKPILVYDGDGREAETDIFYAAQFTDAGRVETLRTVGGGLVFLAVGNEIARRMELPFLQDLYAEDAKRHPVLAKLAANDIRYDARSSFSLTLNHRKTFTGITDEDRALTIRRFATLAEEIVLDPRLDGASSLGAEFRSPGHVHLCIASARPFIERKGHTELGVALLEMSGLTPVMAGCEMLGKGRALAKAEAALYARKTGAPFLEGATIAAAYEKYKKGNGDSAPK
ncbi:MAG: 3,4-dihydroxy-2-butanone-4-phosphate synthase [Euryarchaeota archaeon]|nr:3,4-dihydroxy-2-butanone-4-phosphate synthase [Euryarchaeota archaeon]